MPIEPHLKLTELVLPPGGEWAVDHTCWTATRVVEGIGYCRHDGLTQELAVGDAIIAGPNSGVLLRASQLDTLRLEFFRVVPQRLNGLITVVELRELERISNSAASSIVAHHAFNEPLAQKFTRLTGLPERDSLAARSSFLQLWASCVVKLLPSLNSPLERNVNLLTSFQRLVNTISEKDLATCSLADMAVQLKCSERHLSRLFRSEFGVSFREKQTQLSLQRACQLLLDPQTKIRNVAYDSGYRHVGFFNALFKKRFGVTPKEWRQQNLSSSVSPSDELAFQGD